MDHFLVFTARKFKNVMGAKGLTWEIAGIFKAPTQELACLKGMQETGHGTAFAVAGFAFGVDMADVSEVSEFGKTADPASRLDRLENMLADSLTALTRPRAHELPEGDVEDDA